MSAARAGLRRMLEIWLGHADDSIDTGAGTAGAGGRIRTAWGGTGSEVVAVCNGCLVLHRDGEIAYCSEELDGRPCAGYGEPHLAGVMSCRVSPRRVVCRRCQHAMQFRLIVAPEYVPEHTPVDVN